MEGYRSLDAGRYGEWIGRSISGHRHLEKFMFSNMKMHMDLIDSDGDSLALMEIHWRKLESCN
jgi:hypothetical protein